MALHTVHEIEDKAGLTLADLTIFTARCFDTAPDAMVMARVSMGGKLTRLSVKAEREVSDGS